MSIERNHQTLKRFTNGLSQQFYNYSLTNETFGEDTVNRIIKEVV
jgi:hypothetical protein